MTISASRRFLTRPEPSFFDELARCIAHAVEQMPKLEYLDLEFNAKHQGRHSLDKDFLGDRGSAPGSRENFHQYEGWSFHYRASNKARFASEYPKTYMFEHEPGLDRTEMERPRTEWVFQCPFGDLQWEEPDAAKDSWRKRCAQTDFDVIALSSHGTSWESRRNGELIPLLGEGFATRFAGRPDLKPIPEGIR